MASTWPPGLVPLAPSLLGTPFSSFYYASPPLRERETEGERPRPTDRLIVRVCVWGGTRTVCERAFKEWSFLALTYCNGARILTREGRVKTLNVIVESGVVRIIGDQGQRSQISLMSLN